MDLSTEYLGFELPGPFIVGACPLADDFETLIALERAGASAVVLRSLFEEQIRGEVLASAHSTEAHAESFGEALSFFPEPDGLVMGPHEYVRHLGQVKEALHIPVIASLNGTTPGGWLDYARQLADAGADALELNLYSVATDPAETAAAIEQRAVDMVEEVKRAVKIPLAVKLSPFYTGLANFAHRLDEAGADGLVLFNRFFEPDIDLEELEVLAQLRLSDSSELLLRLRWLAILSGNVGASLAVTGGVHTGLDALKAVMCGAGAVQLVSVLLREGPGHVSLLLAEIREWLQEHEYESLRQAQGSMNLTRCPDPASFERGNYARMLQTWQP
ncbi:MAG: dihydroorotate dehydrogenase-like protein [bacterium]|nr:dihydroorotate dehydrogenase-like protein [bacterium]